MLFSSHSRGKMKRTERKKLRKFFLMRCIYVRLQSNFIINLEFLIRTLLLNGNKKSNIYIGNHQEIHGWCTCDSNCKSILNSKHTVQYQYVLILIYIVPTQLHIFGGSYFSKRNFFLETCLFCVSNMSKGKVFPYYCVILCENQ